MLVDTSIWVRFHELENPMSERCAAALDRAVDHGVVLFTCAQVIIEFWAVASRPRSANGLSMTFEAVERAVQDIFKVCRLAVEPPDMAHRFDRLASRYRPVGKHCNDVRLVALAESAQLKSILTLNPGDFRAFQEVSVVEP